MDEAIPRATTVAAAGTWPEDPLRDTVTVDFDDRFRRRRLYTGEGGLAFLLAPSGVPAEQAVAIGLLWFLTTIANGLVGGLLFLLDRTPSHQTPAQTPAASLQG